MLLNHSGFPQSKKSFSGEHSCDSSTWDGQDLLSQVWIPQKSPQFLEDFVRNILSAVDVRSLISVGRKCFCLEILIGRDDHSFGQLLYGPLRKSRCEGLWWSHLRRSFVHLWESRGSSNSIPGGSVLIRVRSSPSVSLRLNFVLARFFMAWSSIITLHFRVVFLMFKNSVF